MPISALACWPAKGPARAVLAGIGPRLVVHPVGQDAASSVWVQVLDGQRVHGIRPGGEDGEVVCRGGNQVALCRIDRALTAVELVVRIELDDGIIDAGLFEGTLACLTAHNAVKLYTVDRHSNSARLYAAFRSPDQTLLFSGCLGPIIPRPDSDQTDPSIPVAAGTATGPIHLWLCPLPPPPPHTPPSTEPPDQLQPQVQPTAHSWSGHPAAAFDLAFSPSGTQLASASDDRSVRIWDLPPPSVLLDRIRHPREHARPSGKEHDVGVGEPRRTLWGHTGRVWRVAWSSDSNLVSAGEDGRAIGWGPVSDRQGAGWDKVGVYEYGHDGRSIWAVACSPSLGLVATGGADGGIKLWPSPSSSDPSSSRTSLVSGPLKIRGPDGQTVKTFTVLSDRSTVFLSKSGSVYRLRSGTRDPTQVYGFAREAWSVHEQYRFATSEGGRRAYLASSSGHVTILSFPAPPLYPSSPGADGPSAPGTADAEAESVRLQETTVSGWKVVRDRWGLVYDRRRGLCRIFDLHHAGQGTLSALCTCVLSGLGTATTMHLVRLSEGSLLLAGMMDGSLATFKVDLEDSGAGSVAAVGPLTVTKLHSDGISDIVVLPPTDPASTAAAATARGGKLILSTLGRDGLVSRHRLDLDTGEVETFDERKLLHGWLERWVVEASGSGPDGVRLAVGFEDGRCKLFRTDGQLVRTWPCRGIPTVWDLSASSGELAFTYLQEGGLVVHPPPHSTLLKDPIVRPGAHGREVRSVALWPIGDGGSYVGATVAENGVLRVTRYSNDGRDQLLWVDPTLGASLKSVIWIDGPRHGLFLAVGGARELLRLFRIDLCPLPTGDGNDIFVRPWLTASEGSLTNEIRIMGLDFSLSSHGQLHLCAGYSDGTVRLWETDLVGRTARLVAVHEHHRACVLAVKCVGLANGEKVALSGATDGSIWAIRNAAIPAQSKPERLGRLHANGVNCLDAVLATDDTLIVATGGDDTSLVVSSWRPGRDGSFEAHGEPVRVASAHASSITGLQLLDGSELILTAGADQRMTLWECKDGAVRRVRQEYTHVADVGDLSASTGDDTITVCLAGIGTEMRNLPRRNAPASQ